MASHWSSVHFTDFALARKWLAEPVSTSLHGFSDL